MSKKSKNQGKKSANSVGNQQKSSQGTMLKIPNSFTATLTILTDWHIGSGAGRTGDIDSLVKRDKDDFPYIPAKTLTGIWRDACELVALALDNGNDKTDDNSSWQKWVNYLFGDQPKDSKHLPEKSPREPALPVRAAHLTDSKHLPEKFPREAALSVRAAHLSDFLRKALQDKLELKNALTFVKPGIKINAENGCAIEDCLRFEEMVRGGTILNAECKLNLENLNAEQKHAAYGLLIAGTKLVERLGGKRRRGSGKCELEVVKDIKPWIDWIEKHPEPPVIPKPTKNNINGKEIQFSEDETWLSIPLRIITKSPLVISKRTVGNVVETLDYIPGTHLLPIVSKKLAGLGFNIGNAIASGHIIVTNATIEVGGEKGRPVPFALFREKLGGGLKEGCKVHNRFVEPEPKETQLKGERVGYIGSMENSDLLKYKTVDLAVETHNTIQDDVQRPTSDVGGVYSYEAIAPGTVLRSELRLRKSIADAIGKKNQNWWESLHLNGDYSLGQSKKDDYGQVFLEVLKPTASSQTASKIQTSELLTVWLLSDVLLRDQRLRPTTSIDDLGKELGEFLGVKLILKQSKDDKLTLIARQNRIESWQVKWRLPRPSLVGLAAGTCAVFEVDKEAINPLKIDPLKLAEIEKTGIGERRAEGYGQICFNDPIWLRETLQLKAEKDDENNKPQQDKPQHSLLIEPEKPDFSYARIVEKAAWREAISRAALKFAANPNRFGIKRDRPTMSQLGALRSVLRRLGKPENPAEPGVILKWLKHIEETPNQKDKWELETLQEIRSLITDETEIWKLLEFDFLKFTLTSTGERDLKGQQWQNMTDEQWQKSDQLWTETIQILFDACIRAHKRDIEAHPNSTQEQGVE